MTEDIMSAMPENGRINEPVHENAGRPAEAAADLSESSAAVADAAPPVDPRIAELEREVETARNDLLYALAETQNVRRRLEKDIADARAHAHTAFARDMLIVADNLARALEAIPVHLREDEHIKGVVTGIETTERELEKVFSAHGVKKVAAQGLPLDPNQHQAMMEMPDAKAEPGTVIQVLQHGYSVKERLLRPAMVVVAKKPE